MHDAVRNGVVRVGPHTGWRRDAAIEIKAADLPVCDVGFYRRLPRIVRDGAEYQGLASRVVIDGCNFVARDGLGGLDVCDRDTVVTEPHVVVEGDMKQL